MRKLILTILTCLLGSTNMLLMADDADDQLKDLNELVEEMRHKKSTRQLATALCRRAVFYYNHAMDDSIIQHVPQDLEEIKATKEWDKYYELWSYLVNSYIFSGRTNLALREAQAVTDDAMQRDNDYGQGIGFYALGSVYASMRSLDESAESYQKSIELLSGITPYPAILPDVFSSCGDILNMKHDYVGLQKLTERWGAFLKAYINANPSGNKLEEELSEELYNETTKLSPAAIKILYSYYYIASAQAALGMNDLKQAERLLTEARKNIASEDDYAGHSWLFYLTDLRIRQQRYQEAYTLNTRRLEQAEREGDMTSYVDIIHQRAEIMNALGLSERAAECYKRLYEINDSMNAADTKRQLTEMNTLFHVDELKMKQERAQFRNTLIIVGLIIVALVIFVMFRIRAARRLKKAHDQLQDTHEKLLTAYDQLEETTAAKERIESDLRIARNIQMGMVPRTFPERADLDLYASMTPAKEVGGDLYGYHLVEENPEHNTPARLYFCLGDVSGKGVPASLFMAQATRLFRTLAAQEMKPAEIAIRINNALSGEDNETGMFVTMFIGLIDLSTGHLDFCNAGHNPPVLLRDGKPEFIEMVPNAPVGIIPELEFEGEEIADITNCPLFVYTDGLNVAENRQQEQFTDERLLDIMGSTPFVSCQQTIEMLREEVEKHRDGAEPNDDLTMICVKVIKDNTK